MAVLDTLHSATVEALGQIDEEKVIRKTNEMFLLFSMGSQFDHLIKQALARLGVYCQVANPATMTERDVRRVWPKGIILSGGPASVYSEPPPFDSKIFDMGIPVLGICLGFQMWAKHVGATVACNGKREFGRHEITLYAADSPLLSGFAPGSQVLQSHGDHIQPHENITVLGSTTHAPLAAGCSGHLWGVQFHPEVTDTDYGDRLFSNFCFDICGARDVYPAQEVSTEKIGAIRKKIGDKKVLLALSGGSDSTVVCHLVKHAVSGEPGRVRAVYIRGVDRPDDERYVRMLAEAEREWLELLVVDATDSLLADLAGKVSMKDKRLAMRGVYKEVLESMAKAFDAEFIAQGTLYTDISESGHGLQTGARKAQIKQHHNVGLGFSLPELTPLDDCVKDGARAIGRQIGVSEEYLVRHPFPGPGMVVRIEGEVTPERLRVARQADEIFVSALREAGLYEKLWQAGVVITQSVSTHTKGDDAGMGLVLALWAVWSVNGFTANFAKLPWEFLEMVSRRLTNEIREVSRVVYAISDKPPATIEWG